MKAPDQASDSFRAEDIAKRRRGMLATVMTSSLGLGSPPSTTSKLGG